MLSACSKFLLSIATFMVRAGQTVPIVPAMPSRKDRAARTSFILGETLEYADAAGVTVTLKPEAVLAKLAQFNISTEQADAIATAIASIDLAHADDNKSPLAYACERPGDLPGMTDGLADILYTAKGGLAAQGTPDDPVEETVADNNMEKFGLGGYRNDAGKWIKPKDHKKPDFHALLIRLGWNGSNNDPA